MLSALKKMDIEATEADVAELFEQFDTDGSGAMQFSSVLYSKSIPSFIPPYNPPRRNQTE
jgi:Ca2+-binding EF-hand superfamily protein